jgi:hypothetical protein
MPNLKHLLDDLAQPDISPEEVRIPGQLYDSLIPDCDEADEEDTEDEK